MRLSFVCTGPGGPCMQAGSADLFRGSLSSDPSLEKEGNWWCRGTCRVCLATTACQGICRVPLHTYFRDSKDPRGQQHKASGWHGKFLFGFLKHARLRLGAWSPRSVHDNGPRSHNIKYSDLNISLPECGAYKNSGNHQQFCSKCGGFHRQRRFIYLFIYLSIFEKGYAKIFARTVGSNIYQCFALPPWVGHQE